jgi:hypothetical protein
MPSRAYVAHDRAISAARMYVQMGVVGFLLASALYAGVMTTFLTRYVAGPIPELRIVDGKHRLKVDSGNPRLPLFSLVKYYVSLNPKNYLSIQLSSKRLGGWISAKSSSRSFSPFSGNGKWRGKLTGRRFFGSPEAAWNNSGGSFRSACFSSLSSVYFTFWLLAC